MSAPGRERAAARADFCRFLAACYYEPGVEFAQEKLFDAMRASAARIAPELVEEAEALGKAFSAAQPQDLLVDYTRLFLGPGPCLAQPHESSWLGPSSERVADTYAEAGFEIEEGFGELPDHVAAELEFLQVLIYNEATSLERRFLDRHLGRWIARFSQAVRSGAESAFYRKLATLTEKFVEAEALRCHARPAQEAPAGHPA